MGVKYKYFFHYDASGNIIGHDMAPEHLTESDFEQSTIEVEEEFFKENFTDIKDIKFKIDPKEKKVIPK